MLAPRRPGPGLVWLWLSRVYSSSCSCVEEVSNYGHYWPWRVIRRPVDCLVWECSYRHRHNRPRYMPLFPSRWNDFPHSDPSESSFIPQFNFPPPWAQQMRKQEPGTLTHHPPSAGIESCNESFYVAVAVVWHNTLCVVTAAGHWFSFKGRDFSTFRDIKFQTTLNIHHYSFFMGFWFDFMQYHECTFYHILTPTLCCNKTWQIKAEKNIISSIFWFLFLAAVTEETTMD